MFLLKHAETFSPRRLSCRCVGNLTAAVVGTSPVLVCVPLFSLTDRLKHANTNTKAIWEPIL